MSAVSRIRRGMTAIVITPSLDRGWVKPLATLKSRGVACVVITMDVPAFERRVRRRSGARPASSPSTSPSPSRRRPRQQWRALRHALAEFDIAVYRVGPTQPLAEALAS